MDGWMNETARSARATGRTFFSAPASCLCFRRLHFTRNAPHVFTPRFLLFFPPPASAAASLFCFCFFTLFIVRDDLLLESDTAAAALLMKLLLRRRWPVPKIQNIVEFNNIKVAQDETVDRCGRCVVEIQVCGARGRRRGGGQGQKLLRSTSESSPAAAAAAASITKA